MVQVHCLSVSTVCTSSKHCCGTGKSKHCCPFEYAAGQYGGEWQQQFSSSACLQGASFRTTPLESFIFFFIWSFSVINQSHCREAIRRISHRFPLLCRRLWSHLPVISVTCHNKNVCRWWMCNLQESQTLRFITQKKSRIVAAAGGVSVDVCHTGFSFSRNKLEVKVSCQRLTASLCLRAASLFTLPSPRFPGSRWNLFTII